MYVRLVKYVYMRVISSRKLMRYIQTLKIIFIMQQTLHSNIHARIMVIMPRYELTCFEVELSLVQDLFKSTLVEHFVESLIELTLRPSSLGV